MEDRIYRPLVCFLLTGILICQIISIVKMPPTISDLKNAKTKEEKQALYNRLPLVDAHVSNTVSVDVMSMP